MNKTPLMLMALTIALTACNKHTSADATSSATPPAQSAVTPQLVQQKVNSPATYALPKAVVYKTRADYSNNVPVGLNGSRTGIVSYPDPRDISQNMKPLPLANGYLLDRRGIGTNVAFTSYTYEQYAALKSVPSTAALLESVIDSHPLTEMYTLPVNSNEAQADTAKVNDFIRNGFSGCSSLLPPPVK